MNRVANIALVERYKPTKPPPKPSNETLMAAVEAFKWCLSGMPRAVGMDSAKLARETSRCLRDVVVMASELGIDLPIIVD